MDQLHGSARRIIWTDQLDGPAGWTSWTDQMDGPAGWTSLTDQLFLFEALASSHIRRLTFQFVHCCSFRVRLRPCSLFGEKLIWIFAMSTNEHSRALMAAWHHTLECIRVSGHTSAHGQLWVHISALWGRWVLSAQVLDSKINKKCWVLKWPTCSILTISRSKFHRKIKNWIFSKSTQNGLLKNV